MAIYIGDKKIAGLVRSEDISHATETHAGIIEIATQGEVLGGANDTKAVTPTKLKQYYYGKIEANVLFAGKQDVIPDLATIRDNAELGAGIIPQVESNTQRIEELTTSKMPNATPIGKPQITGSYVSGFTADDYYIFPFTDISHGLPFEIYFSFTTDDDVITQQNILDSHFGIALAIQNAKGVVALSSNGTNWDIGTTTGTNTILPNTTYYAKMEWTGTQYKTALSLDKESFVSDMTLNSNLSPYKTTIYIGGSPNIFGPGSAHPFKGIINFNGAKVIVKGLEVWNGYADIGFQTRANVSLSNLDEAGLAMFSKGNSAYEAMLTYGNIVTHNINEFLLSSTVISDLVNEAQLNAINSTITSNKVSDYDSHLSNGTIHVTANDKVVWSQKQPLISDLETIRSNAQAGKSANDTIATYGDIVTHNANEFLTEVPSSYVKNTDFASLENAGIIKLGNNLQLNSDNIVYASSNTYDQYESAGDNIFIGKGTLNNVLAGRGYITSSYHDSTKQDIITDLEAIRTGAGLGATAIQSVKTINNENIVGTGNIDIAGGGAKIIVTRYT